jgi:hypothetical protein
LDNAQIVTPAGSKPGSRDLPGHPGSWIPDQVRNDSFSELFDLGIHPQTTHSPLPELSNFWSPPAEPGVYLKEIMRFIETTVFTKYAPGLFQEQARRFDI